MLPSFRMTDQKNGGKNMGTLFDGFIQRQIETSQTSIHVVLGGKGPPVLLLHGYPQSHVMWHKIAPWLAQDFTVVAPDLRGYGDSSKPPGDPDHTTYSKRAMALDQVEVMAQLGYDRFMVVGHDRGGRVGHRMALDHTDKVQKLAVLDIAPTLTMYRQTNMAFATAYYHWFFLIQPAPFPETLIGASAEFYLRSRFERPGIDPNAFPPEALAEYQRCFCDPACIHATCEDYRAAATIDLVHDQADLDRKVACPVLALWGSHGFVGHAYDVIATWQERATRVTGQAVPSGHFLPEEAPVETYTALRRFLRYDT